MPTSLLTNGDFATDLSGWTIDAETGVVWSTGKARIGVPGANGYAILKQDVDIPAGSTHVDVTFTYQWQATAPATPDYFKVEFIYSDSATTGTTTVTIVDNESSDSVTFNSDIDIDVTIALEDLKDELSNGTLLFRIDEDNAGTGTRIELDDVVATARTEVDSVGSYDSLGPYDSVGDSIGDSVGDSIGDSLGFDSVKNAADVEFKPILGELAPTGNTDFTSPGFGTPKAAIAIIGNANTTNNPQGNAAFSIGFTDFTSEWCVTYDARDNKTTSSTARQHTAARFLSLVSADTSAEYIGWNVSSITDGIRLTPTGSSSVTRYVHIILIGGDDVEAYVGNYDDLGTGTSEISITGAGFEPTLGFFTCVGLATAVPAIAAHALMSFGCATQNGSDLDQGFTAFSSKDNVGTMKNTQYHSMENIVGQAYDDALQWQAALTSFDSDGFTIKPESSSGSDVIGFLLLRLSGGASAHLNNVDFKQSGVTEIDMYSDALPHFAMFSNATVLLSGAETVETLNGYGYTVVTLDEDAAHRISVHGQDNLVLSDNNATYYNDFRFVDFNGSYRVWGTDWEFHESGLTVELFVEPTFPSPAWALLVTDGYIDSVGEIDSYGACDVNIEVTRALVDETSGVDTDITIAGFGTPKAAIFITSRATADETTEDRMCYSFGFTDGVNEVSANSTDLHGQTTTRATRGHTTTGVMSMSTGTGSSAAEAVTFVEWITDGVRVQGSGTGTASTYMTVILINGDSVTGVHAGLADLGTTTNGLIDITDIGFEPGLVFTATSAYSFAGTNTSHAHVMLGAVVNHGLSVEQAALAIYSQYGASTSNNSAEISESYCVSQVLSSRSWYGVAEDFDDEGFSIQLTGYAGGDDMIYIAIGFAQAPNMSIQQFNWPTTGDVNLDLGFKPSFGFIPTLGRVGGAVDTVYTVDSSLASFAISAMDENGAYTMGGSMEGGVTTTNTSKFTSPDIRVADRLGATIVQTESETFTDDGVLLALDSVHNLTDTLPAWGLFIGCPEVDSVFDLDSVGDSLGDSIGGPAAVMGPAGLHRIEWGATLVSAARLNGVLE